MSYLIEGNGQPIVGLVGSLYSTTLPEPSQRIEQYISHIRYRYQSEMGYSTDIGEQDKVRIKLQWTWNAMSRTVLESLRDEINYKNSTIYIYRYGGTNYERYFIDRLTIKALTGNIGYTVVLQAHSQNVYARDTL